VKVEKRSRSSEIFNRGLLDSSGKGSRFLKYKIPNPVQGLRIFSFSKNETDDHSDIFEKGEFQKRSDLNQQ